MTLDEKLNALKEAWGYVEVSQATILVSGLKIWLVKNYKGRPIQEMPEAGLPGNPAATRKIEHSGNTPAEGNSQCVSFHGERGTEEEK